MGIEKPTMAKIMKLIKNSSIKEALKVIEIEGQRIATILNEDKTLYGIITDSDIRRAIVNGANLESSIKNIIIQKPIVAYENSKKDDIIKLALKHTVYEIPILNSQNQVVKIESISKLLSKKTKTNEIILMVGGLGTRLRPLTDTIPKPMLKVGAKPILQIIIERFVKQGFCNFTLCTGYKSEVIESFFKDGSKFGANIKYVKESKRLGTAGALGLINESLKEPFIVMNGDILTEISFDSFLEFHIKKQAIATMGVREFEYQVPYGVVETKDGFITQITEKPLERYLVSAGVYVLNPEILQQILKNTYLDMPNLFLNLLKQGQKTSYFPINDYWIDIGRHEEYERANDEM